MTTDEVITRATDAARPRLSDLARDLGVSSQVLTQWRTGKRAPHPDNLEALARALRRQAERVVEEAAALEALAELLRDPEERERVVPQTATRSKPEDQKKPQATPQLRTREGCLRWFKVKANMKMRGRS